MSRILLFVLFVLCCPTVHAQVMPSPVLLPDPGARCPGWLPCSDIDPWALTLRLDPWMAPATKLRGHAGGLRASLSMDVARRFEIGVAGGFVAWEGPGPDQRHLGWRLLSAHGRALIWPWTAPAGRLALVATYQHEWAGDTGYGLLQPGGTIGRGTLSAHLPLWDAQVNLGASAGCSYAPGSGAALAELGLHASVQPPDPNHRVAFFLELGARLPLRGAAGSAGGWGAVGWNVISRDWGLESSWGILASRGAEETLPAILFVMRLAQHFGAGYTPPQWGPPLQADELRQAVRHKTIQQLPTALQRLPPQSLTSYLRSPSADADPALAHLFGPGDWYPPGRTELPDLHSPLDEYLRPPPRRHWGQVPPRPPRVARPPSPPGPARAGQGAQRNPEIEAEAETPAGQLRRGIAGTRPPPGAEPDPMRSGQEPPPPTAVIRPPATRAASAPSQAAKAKADEAWREAQRSPYAPQPREPEAISPEWAEAVRHLKEGTHPPVISPPPPPPPPPQTGRPPNVEFTRAHKRDAYEQTRSPRDGQHKCEECGNEQVAGTPDQPGVPRPGNRSEGNHIIPVTRGGTRSPSNLSSECADCNNEQGGNYIKPWTKNPVDPRMPFAPRSQAPKKR